MNERCTVCGHDIHDTNDCPHYNSVLSTRLDNILIDLEAMEDQHIETINRLSSMMSTIRNIKNKTFVH